MTAKTTGHKLSSRAGRIMMSLAFTILLIGGCAPKTQIVLLPEADSRVGVLEVSTDQGTQTLNQAWQSTESASMGTRPAEPKVLEKEAVQQAFREALAAEPIPPVNFIIYFRTDSAELSKEYMTMMNKVLEAIQTRKSTDIIISGHTDAVGSVDHNRNLSLRRARTVADILVAAGIDRQTIQVTYHGKGNTLVPTPDGVAEPRNRRVEITVR